MTEFQGQVLNQGMANGEVIVFDEPLSFWGGFDARKGMVIDKQHPQYGVVITGKILIMPGSRGSAGTPGVLAEALRLDTGPIGIILNKPDINVATGALVVSKLYGKHCPVVALEQNEFETLSHKQTLEICIDGVVVANS